MKTYNKLRLLLKPGQFVLISDIADVLDFCRQELAVDIVDILLEKWAMSPERDKYFGFLQIILDFCRQQWAVDIVDILL